MEAIEKYDKQIIYPKINGSFKSGHLLSLGGYLLSAIKQEGFSKALKNILHQLYEKMKKGQLKNIMFVSKPAQMSLYLSFIQCIANQAFPFIENLKKAAKTKDLLTRMQLITVSYITGLTINLKKTKGLIPLDPFIGQTFQGQFQDISVSVQCLNTSKFYLLMTDKQGTFKLTNFVELTVGLNSMNSVYANSTGKYEIKFYDGQIFQLSHAPSISDGLLVGNPTFHYYDVVKLKCKNSPIFAQLKFNYKNEYTLAKISKGIWSYFSGNQSQSSNQFTVHFFKNMNYQNSQKAIQIDKGFGDWLSHIVFHDNVYRIKEYQVQGLWKRPKLLLQSDCRLRLDGQFLYQKNLKEGQMEKIKLEQQERRDRQLRRKNNKN